MKVKDIMTEPAMSCRPDTSLAVAARLMRDGDYGTLAVVNARGRLEGVVTDRDICLTLAASTRNALNLTVHEAMTHKVFSAREDENVKSALTTMKQRRVRRLPVVDAGGHLKGIVSVEDVVVRGLENGDISPADIVDALRTMYIRVPVAAESAVPGNGYTPG